MQQNKRTTAADIRELIREADRIRNLAIIAVRPHSQTSSILLTSPFFQ
jgi:hypothetical protein